MSLLDEAIDELYFEALGGEQSDALSAAIQGPSPYNGGLPFAVELGVFIGAVDGDFVVSVRREASDETVAQVVSSLDYDREGALCLAAENLLHIPRPDSLAELTATLADIGYRFVSTPTGATTGHTERVLFIADTISELDAAVALGSDPEYIYWLLDDGADPMRSHIKFGRPYAAARRLASGPRPDYAEVVAYMNACGAHC